MAATDGRAVAHAAFVCFLGASTILVSSGVIAFNKYLMHEDRFPFAVPLVMCHMCFSSIMSLGLYLTFPFLFPSRSDPEKKVPMDRNMLKGVLPIAFLFSMQLVGSNAAYLHSTVGFLQMMKESQLLFVYIFSVFLAVEVLTLRSCTLICWILAATTLTVQGELNFSFTGFALQGSCVVVESFRLVLQGLMLAPGGRKLDPLTYVMLVSPLCFGFLTGFLLFLNYVMPMQILATPSWHHIATWWPMLLACSCLAFLLNVIVSFFVKHSSPVAVILTGLLKDVAIVTASGLIFHEAISHLQILGFMLQIFGIFLWSIMRAFPDQFQDGVLQGFRALGAGSKLLCSTLPVAKTLKKDKDKEDKVYGSIEAGQGSSRD